MRVIPRLPATIAVAVALTNVAGCASYRVARPSAPPAAPVALVAEGSALTSPNERERIAQAIKEMTGRSVLLVDPIGDRNDPRRSLAARLARDIPDLSAYDWKEPRCAAERLVLVALATSADAVYRVALDITERTRPATRDDLGSVAAHGGHLRAALATIRRRAPKMAHDESIVGSVGLTDFQHDTSPPRVRVERHATGLDEAPDTALDLPTIVTAALRDLPPARLPEWEVYSRRLIATGCPLLALSVAEARLGSGSVSKSVKATALAAMRRGTERRAPRETAAAEAREPTPPAAAARPAEAPSCNALCDMHMVELCNNDRSLWIAHRARWETTPCGTRRHEPFLEECYRQQWQNGTFNDACLVPCETTAEGRERLESIMRRSGCLPGGPSPSAG